MPADESVLSIQIKNQHGGVINSLDGDQVIDGGQHGTAVTSQDAAALRPQPPRRAGGRRFKMYGTATTTWRS
jgi:hypothetical protein